MSCQLEPNKLDPFVSCDGCGRLTSWPHLCADDSRLHCGECRHECKVCLADQYEQLQVETEENR